MSDLQAITPVQSITDLVYEKLKAAILADVFKKGERLVEQEIAAKLNVSRTPVRSVLQRLEAEGILTNSGPSHSLVVREYSPDDIREIYMIREALESLAARCAAQNADEGEIRAMRDLLDEMVRVSGTAAAGSEEIFEINRKFSEAFNNASHMPTLVQMIESLREQMIRFRRVSLSGRSRKETALSEHQAMLEAVAAREPDVAAELTRTHIRNALSAYCSSVGMSESADVTKRTDK